MSCHPYLYLSLRLGCSISTNRHNMFMTFLKVTDPLLALLCTWLHLLDFKSHWYWKSDLRLRGRLERRMPISFWLLMLLVPKLLSQSLAKTKCQPNWPKWGHAMHEKLKTLEVVTWLMCILLDQNGYFAWRRMPLAVSLATRLGSLHKVLSKLRVSITMICTYAPVAKLASFWTILVIVVCWDLKLHQIDVKGAYFNGSLHYRKLFICGSPLVLHILTLLNRSFGLSRQSMVWSKADVIGIRNSLTFVRNICNLLDVLLTNQSSIVMKGILLLLLLCMWMIAPSWPVTWV
jgi:hypothetical protein